MNLISHFLLRGWRVAALVLLSLAWLEATTVPLRACSACGDVKVNFRGNFCSQGRYELKLNGAVSAGGTDDTKIGDYTNSMPAETEMALDLAYPMTVTALSSGGGYINTSHIQLSVPGCYTVKIKGGQFSDWTEASTIDDGAPPVGGWQVMIVLKSDDQLAAGQGGPFVKSVHWRGGLGKAASWQNAGTLALSQMSVNSASYSPALLTLVAPASALDVILSGTTLRQVLAPEALVDVATINSSQYELRYYRRADVLAKAGGLYPVTAGAQPYATWRFENPEPANPASGKFLVTELRGGVVFDATLFTTSASGASWTFSHGGGKFVEQRDTVTDGAGNRTISIKHKDDAGVISSAIEEAYHPFAWGEELTARVEDATGTRRTTSYTYDINPANTASYKRLQTVTRPDGSWMRYDYSNDIVTGSQTIKMYEPWLNTPATPNLATSTNSKLTTTVIGHPVVRAGPAVIWNDETVTILGIQAGHTFTTRSTGGELTNQRDSKSGISEITQSYLYNSASDPITFNQPASINYPDGRRDSFTYLAGTYTPASHGFVAGGGAALSTTVAHGSAAAPDGVPLQSTRDTTIRDERGNTVVKKTEVCTGTNSYVLVTETFHDYDADNHLIRSARNGRVVHDEVWVSQRKQSETDEYGMMTSFTYDSLGRIQTETKAGVSASGSLPAQASIVTTYTYDADDHVLTATRAAGGLSLTTATTYLGGRVATQTDENGYLTQTTYTPDGTTTTTARPDGGTEVVIRNRDGRVQSVGGTGVVLRTTAYSVGANGNIIATEYLGSGTLRWVKTETDWLGRTVKVSHPGFAAAEVASAQSYDATGHVTTLAQAGLANTLYNYDELGRQFRSGLDVDASNSLQPGSKDRITEQVTGFLQDSGQWHAYSRSQTYERDDESTLTILSEVRTQLTGLPATRISRTISIDALGIQTVATLDVNRGDATVTSTVNVPESVQDIVRITRNGLLQSETTATVAAPTRYGYDALRRPVSVTDPRGAFSTADYVAGKNQVWKRKDHLNQTTTFTYQPQGQPGAGKPATQTNGDSTVQRMSYTLPGELARVWGNASYPLEYLYNSYGERETMRTYRNDAIGWEAATWPGGPAVADSTTWVYQPATGLLTSKRDAGGQAVNYQYEDTADFRLKKRTWARGAFTTYLYDLRTGELLTVDYSDATTPDVAFTYDRRGRAATVSDGSGQRKLAYDAASHPTLDQYTGGAMTGVSVAMVPDSLGRVHFLRTSANGTGLTQTEYTYSASNGRLESVLSGDATARYTYEQSPASDLVAEVAFQRAGTERFKTTRQYDALGRHSSITHRSGNGTVLASLTSGATDYDSMNRRTKRTDEDGLYWQYGYDLRGEVQAGDKHTSAGPYLAGEQFGYSYDAIGNRNTSTTGGDAAGSNRRTATYTSTSLNQYLNRTVPEFIEIQGTSTADAVVTVNGLPTDRQGTAWRKELPVSNATAPAVTTVTVAGSRSGTPTPPQTGKVFAAKTPEAFTYDVDGNLTGDGRWTYTWDTENRLIAVQATNAATLAGAAGIKRTYTYDYLGRRTSRTIHTPSGAASAYTYTAGAVTRFIYSGWNLLAEINVSAVLQKSYVWGLDLSGTLQGAGGVGGLLFFEDRTQPTRTLHAAAADELGNIIALVNTASGARSAAYEYGPFGEPLRATGAMAKLNPFRFSTHYADEETGLVYYGYRCYQPLTGRWLSRDPMEEQGGINLYAFVRNKPVNRFDTDGRAEYENWTGQESYTPAEAERDSRIAGEISFNLHDYVDNAATGTITLGVELLRTGELRLDYARLAAELKAKGLSDADASVARDALKVEFRAKQTQLGNAITQAELRARQQSGFTSSRANATKTNVRLNAQARVFKSTGRALAVVGFAVEIYNIASAPEGERLHEAARASGRVGGGFAGGAASGAVLGALGANPLTIGIGALIGGFGGSVAGEAAVDLVCPLTETRGVSK